MSNVTLDAEKAIIASKINAPDPGDLVIGHLTADFLKAISRRVELKIC